MIVFKFGGASVKDVSSIKNVLKILDNYKDESIFIVISAMDKMTNAFEKLTSCYFENKICLENNLENIKKFHYNIANGIFSEQSEAHKHIDILFDQLENKLKQKPGNNYNFVYDSIVPYGELLSSTILSFFLNQNGFKNMFVDARQIIKTDANYREARINWDLTVKNVRETQKKITKENYKIAVTQGFIGSSFHGYNTTLGREGSDFTAAILGYSLKAKEVVIWKDVPGVLNADPKYFNDTTKIDRLSYFDAIELAYYGATVIHPKTIKPLQNAGIPLYVKSFLKAEASGTHISNFSDNENTTPCFIFKINQILISIMPFDFSFIVEHNISNIFLLLSKYNVKVNLMQNSALSFSICVDDDPLKTPSLIKDLKSEYKIFYNNNLELVTIRNYNEETIERICSNKEVLLEQKSRNTVQFVLRNN